VAVGAGSLVDLRGASTYAAARRVMRRRSRAQNDWEAIGADMWHVLRHADNDVRTAQA